MCATEPAAAPNEPQQDLKAFLAESLSDEFQSKLAQTSLSPEQIRGLVSLAKGEAFTAMDVLRALGLVEGQQNG